jgi:hypothetical protein
MRLTSTITGRSVDSGRGRHASPLRGVLFVLLALAVIGFGAGLLAGGSAQADTGQESHETRVRETPSVIATWDFSGNDGKAKTPIPQTPPPGTTPTPPIDNGFEGWERFALRDLAEVRGWPTVVALDSSGRMRVQDVVSQGEWTMAHIRAFEYSAGAAAAFAAEQEDSRLAGYTVQTETFYSARAFMAVLTSQSGNVIERRFRWITANWILGVDAHLEESRRAPNVYLIAEELLTLAVRRGLPPTGQQIPTPNPTWVLPPLPTATARRCAQFEDVPTDYWAYSHISQLACSGIVVGYQDGTFRPENSTTRAQLAKMLVLSQNWQLVSPADPTFLDVPRTHPFYRYVETALARGVVSGYGDGRFRPDAYVTRAQVAKMIVRTRGWSADLSNTVPQCDVSSGHWAWSYVQAAIQRGIFTGYEDGCFRPDMYATRAQLSKVLVLALR